jgi:hypothetical protein
MQNAESSTAQTRFARAVILLATGAGRIQERLAAALLEILPVQSEDIPEQLQDIFRIIEDEMLAQGDPEEWSDEAAVAAAERIVLMELQLRGR